MTFELDLEYCDQCGRLLKARQDRLFGLMVDDGPEWLLCVRCMDGLWKGLTGRLWDQG